MQSVPEFCFYCTSSAYIFCFHRPYDLLELLWNKLQYLWPSKYTLLKAASVEYTLQTILWGCQCQQVTKNYTLNFHSAFDWMVLTQDLKAIYIISQRKGKSHRDNKSKERFYNQRVFESRCRRKNTVDKDLLITYRFSVRKFSQPIIATSDLLHKQGIRNNFHKLLTNITWIKSLSKTVSWNKIHRSLLRRPWPYHFIW